MRHPWIPLFPVRLDPFAIDPLKFDPIKMRWIGIAVVGLVRRLRDHRVACWPLHTGRRRSLPAALTVQGTIGVELDVTNAGASRRPVRFPVEAGLGKWAISGCRRLSSGAGCPARVVRKNRSIRMTVQVFSFTSSESYFQKADVSVLITHVVVIGSRDV